MKTIIIIWHWADLYQWKDGEVVMSFIPVENKGGQIIRIRQERLSDWEKWHHEWHNLMDQEILILCHSPLDAPSEKSLSLLKDLSFNINPIFIRFGGGKSYIYYNKKNKTGLILSGLGVFAKNEELGDNVFCEDGVHINEKQFLSVYDFYILNELKQKLYGIKNIIVKELFITSEPFTPGLTVKQWLEEKSDHLENINGRLKEIDFAMADEKYAHLSSIWASFVQSLFLELNEGSAKSIRDSIKVILDKLPGLINS